ncbi:hypothetical protein JB92DRAFT_1899480 [Gautieria morchelliformis]|nr:hypothetical protein JB92DRAFT_1899480 [Gautieria morchelliformis]
MGTDQLPPRVSPWAGVSKSLICRQAVSVRYRRIYFLLSDNSNRGQLESNETNQYGDPPSGKTCPCRPSLHLRGTGYKHRVLHCESLRGTCVGPCGRDSRLLELRLGRNAHDRRSDNRRQRRALYHNQLDTMAAALGLAASVIAVLQLTGASISACYSYGSGVKNASRDKTRMLFGLQRVLEAIRRLVEGDGTAASSRLPALNEHLLRCRDELESFNTALRRDLERKGRVEALIWPLKESEVHKTLDKLGKLQDLLTMAMDIDQTRLTLKIDSRVEALQGQNAEIQKQNARISEAMEQSKLQERLQNIYNWLDAPDHESNIELPVASDRRRPVYGLWRENTSKNGERPLVRSFGSTVYLAQEKQSFARPS